VRNRVGVVYGETSGSNDLPFQPAPNFTIIIIVEPLDERRGLEWGAVKRNRGTGPQYRMHPICIGLSESLSGTRPSIRLGWPTRQTLTTDQTSLRNGI
jgi:hypothetical protein